MVTSNLIILELLVVVKNEYIVNADVDKTDSFDNTDR